MAHQKGTIQWFMANMPATNQQEQPEQRPFKQPRLERVQQQPTKAHLALRYATACTASLCFREVACPPVAMKKKTSPRIFETDPELHVLMQLNQLLPAVVCSGAWLALPSLPQHLAPGPAASTVAYLPQGKPHSCRVQQDRGQNLPGCLRGSAAWKHLWKCCRPGRCGGFLWKAAHLQSIAAAGSISISPERSSSTPT